MCCDDGGIQPSVECYDPKENKWIKKTSIPDDLFIEDSFTGSVLTLSNEVLDKPDVIKEDRGFGRRRRGRRGPHFGGCFDFRVKI